MVNYSKFQQVSRLGVITAPTSLNEGQQNFAECLAVSWLVYSIHIFGGLLLPDGILPGAKFTLRPSLAYRILAALLHGTPAAGVSQTLRRRTQGATYIRQGVHYVGHWPTF